jgi:hypothetical protein
LTRVSSKEVADIDALPESPPINFGD